MLSVPTLSLWRCRLGVLISLFLGVNHRAQWNLGR